MGDKFKELRRKLSEGRLDRPGLIKALRRVRMEAISKGDKEAFEVFGDSPIEVVADRIIMEVGDAGVHRRP